MAKKQPSKGEFAPKAGSKPGAVKRALRADAKTDRAVAKKFGVKFTGHK